MARMPRLVVPEYPHHVTQRGSRRMKIFFCSEDYRHYLSLLTEAREKAGVAIWVYCLMPNHVHLVVLPEQEDSLAQGHLIWRAVMGRSRDIPGSPGTMQSRVPALRDRRCFRCRRYRLRLPRR